MKSPKTSAGAKPATKAAASAKPDPRSVPAPTASAKVAAKAVAAIAPAAAVATAEPKKAAKPAAAKFVAKAPKPTPAKPAPARIATKLPVAARPAPALAATASTAKSAPLATAIKAAEAVLPGGGILPSAEKAIAPLATALEAGADQARAAFARARASGDSVRQAVSDSTSATTRGIVELNGKVIDLLRAQGDATIELWRSAVTAGSLSEAVRAQSTGLRQAYEATAVQWKDIAETATRVAVEAAKPMRTALTPER